MSGDDFGRNADVMQIGAKPQAQPIPYRYTEAHRMLMGLA